MPTVIHPSIGGSSTVIYRKDYADTYCDQSFREEETRRRGLPGGRDRSVGNEARTRMAPDASSRGVGRRRLGPLLGLHASRRVGDEATAKRPSTPGGCLGWPWSSGGDRFSAASSRSSRARLGLVVGRVNSRTICLARGLAIVPVELPIIRFKDEALATGRRAKRRSDGRSRRGHRRRGLRARLRRRRA